MRAANRSVEAGEPRIITTLKNGKRAIGWEVVGQCAVMLGDPRITLHASIRRGAAAGDLIKSGKVCLVDCSSLCLMTI